MTQTRTEYSGEFPLPDTACDMISAVEGALLTIPPEYRADAKIHFSSSYLIDPYFCLSWDRPATAQEICEENAAAALCQMEPSVIPASPWIIFGGKPMDPQADNLEIKGEMSPDEISRRVGGDDE